MPQSWVRRNAMTSWSSSFEGDCTRISVPWIEAWAFLNLRSLIALTMAFAFSCGMPWVRVISRRTVSFAAGVTDPSSRFFTGTLRYELRLQHVEQGLHLEVVVGD